MLTYIRPCHYTKTTRTYKPSSTGDLITSEPLYPAKSEMAVIEKKNEPKNPADDKKAADITTPDHPSTKNEIQTMIFKPNHFTKATVSAQKLSLVADSITSQLLHSPKLEIVLKKKDVHKKSTNDETARIMTQMKPFIKGNIENMNMTWMTTLKDMKVYATPFPFVFDISWTIKADFLSDQVTMVSLCRKRLKRNLSQALFHPSRRLPVDKDLQKVLS